MNWWIVLQMAQWVAQVDSPPAGYLLRDDVFFAQSPCQQRLALDKPDTLLLDIALFQATNEARRQAGLPILHYDRALYQAARNHAGSMIQHDYYGHENLNSLSELTLTKRVQLQTKKFGRMAENIGQYQTIVTPEWFGVRFNARTHRYEYIDSETRQLFEPHTYASYARYAVVQWLNSPHHRANLLNPSYTRVGCAVQLSRAPFQERRAPFGRLVQNFGALQEPTQASR